jgi:hypothetical protein
MFRKFGAQPAEAKILLCAQEAFNDHSTTIVRHYLQTGHFRKRMTSLCVENVTVLQSALSSNRKPAPTWNPVSSPDVLDYARIAYDGLHPGQGLLKERTEFWDSLPLQSRYPTTSDKDEL